MGGILLGFPIWWQPWHIELFRPEDSVLLILPAIAIALLLEWKIR